VSLQDDSDYHRRAQALLMRIASSAEDQLGNDADIEFADSVLNVEIDDQTYVVNKHAPTRQVWLGSPVSGAWHFAWNSTRHAWLDTRRSQDILALLAEEWSAVTGVAVSFG
jgi:frataxin